MRPCFPNPTCGHKGQRPRTLRGMVRDYILHKRHSAQDELGSFSREPVEEAVRRGVVECRRRLAQSAALRRADPYSEPTNH
jgi:hypothetical protein